MYQGLRHMIEGWSKNVYLGGRASFPDEPAARALVPLLLILAAVFWLLPPVVLIATVMGAAPGAQEAAAIASTAAFLFWVIFTAGMRIPAWYGLLYPLGTVILLFIVLRSVWRGGSHVEWKGRIYDIEGETRIRRENENHIERGYAGRPGTGDRQTGLAR